MRMIVAVLCLGLSGYSVAQEVKRKPQYERILPAEDEKKAELLEKQIDDARDGWRLKEAMKKAEELLAIRLKVQGEDHWQVQDAKRIIESLKNPLTIPQQLQFAVAVGMFKKAEGFYTEKKYDEAAKHAEGAVKSFKEILGPKHPSNAEALDLLADTYLEQGNDKAEALYIEAIKVLKEALGEKHPRYATSLFELAGCYRKFKKYDKAETFHREALQIRKEILGDKHEATATSLNVLGIVLENQKKYDEAERYYTLALETRKSMLGEKNANYITVLNNIASMYKSQRKYAKAEETYREVVRLRILVFGQKHVNTAKGHYDLALVLMQRSQNQLAADAFRAAMLIRKELLGEKHADTLDCMNMLAKMQMNISKYDEADALFRTVLRIRKEVLGDKNENTQISMGNLATLLNYQGKYAEAETLAVESLRIRKELHGEKHRDTANGMSTLGSIYWSQGKYAEAEPLYLTSLWIRSELQGENHMDTAVSHVDLGNLYFKMTDKLDKAESHYRKSMQIYKHLFGEDGTYYAVALSNLALVLETQGKLDEAEPLHKSALDIYIRNLGKNDLNTSTSYNNLALLYEAREKYTEAEVNYKQAMQIRRDILGDRHHKYAMCLRNLAVLHWSQGNYAEAEKLLRELTICYEANRMAVANAIERSVGSSELNPYPLLASILARHNKATDAYQTLEMDLARGLLDVQSSSRGSKLTPEEQTRHREATLRLQQLEPAILQLATLDTRSEADQKTLEKLSAERRSLEDTLSSLAADLSRREVADLKEIQAALPSDGALMTWIDIINKYKYAQEHWVCVVRHTGDPIWVQLPGTGENGKWSSEDISLPRQLQASLESLKPMSEIEPLARKVHTQRIAPVEKHLTGVKHLYVASTNVMAGIPVDVITDKYTVSYVPSGTYLAKLKNQPRTTNTRVLALGDVTYKNPADHLPGTLVEINRLATHFGKDRITALSGAKASESELDTLRRGDELKTYKYLHFATHGEANNLKALESSLILAHEALADTITVKPGFPTIDAKLTAGEVLEFWKLDAELVSLSACETALGKSGGGDGLLGFSQAFLKAGSRSVCLSLWRVSDSATVLLMDRFYANMLGKRQGLTAPMAKAAALAEAKLWLRDLSDKDVDAWIVQLETEDLRKRFREAHQKRGKGVDLTIVEPKGDKPYAHPKFWAGFILIGDPN